MSLVDSARASVEAALDEFGSSLAVLSSFQREDVVVTDLVLKTSPSTRVLTLDTGRIPPASNQIIAEVEQRYGIKVERLKPDPREAETMVAQHGYDLFRDSIA